MKDTAKDEASAEANYVWARSIAMKSSQRSPLTVPVCFGVWDIMIRLQHVGSGSRKNRGRCDRMVLMFLTTLVTLAVIDNSDQSIRPMNGHIYQLQLVVRFVHLD